MSKVHLDQLLRNQRRAMARRIKKVRRFTHDTQVGMTMSPTGAWVFLEDVITALAGKEK